MANRRDSSGWNFRTIWAERKYVESRLGCRWVSGAEGDRTLNLSIANAALSQLSYRPDWIRDIK